MRNLKKVLSLSLALVMLLGMMVVGAGAADTGFKDDASISGDYKAAAAVNKALGLMTGDGSNLNPTANIVRAEAFILSLRVDGGNTNEIASKWPVSEKPFNDVSVGKWYAPYLAYGKEMGLIAGNGGNYNPDGNITVVEYSILLLRRLGFDADSTRYTGAGWNTNAVNDAMEAGLYDGLGSMNYYTHQLTRQEACQMVFNALFYSPSGESGYVIDGSKKADATLVYPSLLEAVLAQSQLPDGDKGTIKAAPAGDTLAVKVFKLAPGTTTDDFGRTVNTWLVAGEEVYVSSEAASAPAKTFSKKVGTTDMTKALNGYTINAEAGNVLTNGAEAGEDITDAAGVAELTGNGTVVELYATNKTIDKIVVMEYSVDELKSVTEKDGVTTYEFKTAKKVTNSEQATNAVFEGAVEEGDVVTIAKIGNVHHIYPTTSFEGSQTARKVKDEVYTITVDGKQYVLGDDLVGVSEGGFPNSADDATYFVDVNGYVVARKGAAAAAAQYAVVLKAVGEKTAATLDNSTGYTVNVRAVLADGTIGDYELALGVATESIDDTDISAKDLYSGTFRVLADKDKNDISIESTKEKQNPLNGTGGTLEEGTLIGYRINDKGQMVLAKVGEGMIAADTETVATKTYGSTLNKYAGKTSAKDAVGTGIDVLFTNKTVFVLYHTEGNKWVAEDVITGTAGLKLSDEGVPGKAVITATGTSAGTASVVFLRGESAVEIVDYVYVDATEATLALKGKTSVWQYTGIAADGSEIEVTTGDDGALDKNASGLYPYDEDKVLGGIKVKVGDEIEEVVANGFYSVKIKKVGDLIEVGDSWYTTEEADVVYIASGTDELADGQKALIVMNQDASGVAAVFVVEKGKVTVTDIGETSVEMKVGETKKIEVSADKPSVVSARSSSTATATVKVDGDKVTITAKAVGTADVTITVTPENTQGYATETKTITVTVTAAEKPGEGDKDPGEKEKTKATITGIEVGSKAVGADNTATVAKMVKGVSEITISAKATGGELKITAPHDVTAKEGSAGTYTLNEESTMTNGGTLVFKLDVTPDEDHDAADQITVTVTVTTVAAKFTAGTQNSNASVSVSGNAAEATDIDWKDTNKKDNTSALNGKTISAGVEGKTFTVTFTTTKVEGDNTKVNVSETMSLKEALEAAVAALNAQAAASNEAGAAGNKNYTKIETINIEGTSNAEIRSGTAKTTVMTYNG